MNLEAPFLYFNLCSLNSNRSLDRNTKKAHPIKQEDYSIHHVQVI